MKFGVGISTKSSTGEALEEAMQTAVAAMEGQSADIALIFISPYYQVGFDQIKLNLAEMTGAATIIGCSAQSVIANEHEYEENPGISITLMSLPDVEIRPFYIKQEQLEEFAHPDDIHQFLDSTLDDEASVLLFADPFTFDCITFLDLLNAAFPNRPVLGGMASGATAPGDISLFLNRDIFHEGAVGLKLKGNLLIHSLVSQGCRPIGESLVITDAEENIIRTLAGKPALSVLVGTLEKVSQRDKDLARQSIFVGRVLNEYVHQLKRGDFLIRNLIGVDRQSGALYMNDAAILGETIQFHVRDAESAKEDLRLMAKELKTKFEEQPIAGGLLFCCNGRGQRLFRQPDHDTSTIQQYLGPVPLGGFFCAGEIGPVGNKNYIHGLTASLALFQPRNFKKASSKKQ